jgi:hypothetical protein
MSTKLVDLFKQYGIPPSPLHAVAQEAARQGGWVPPWHDELQKNKKIIAGKKSARSRAGRALIRQYLVEAAHLQLKPKYQRQPYSDEAIDALEIVYRRFLTADDDHGVLVSCMLEALSKADRQALITMSRETLIKDLKVLGIRSRRSVQRSG